MKRSYHFDYALNQQTHTTRFQLQALLLLGLTLAACGSTKDERNPSSSPDAGSTAEDNHINGAGGEGNDADGEGDDVVVGALRLDQGCAVAGQRACDESDATQSLVCEQGKWRSNGTCQEDQACDPATSGCADVVGPCAGLNEGDRYCDINEVRGCGPNLLTSIVIEECSGICIELAETAGCEISNESACDLDTHRLAPASDSSQLEICVVLTPCTVGQQQTADKTSTSDYECRECEPGELCDGSPKLETCTKSGTYCDGASKKDCSAGEYCPDGATIETCISGELCADGKSKIDCTESGTYCDGASKKDCSAGEYCPDGATIETCIPGELCTDGKSKVDCAEQLAWDDDADPTTLCVAWSACEETQKEDLPPTSTTDRTCEDFPWIRQLGTSSDDYVDSVICGDVGGLYLTGSTYGDLQALNQGNEDIFVRKYNSDGDELWTRQFGSADDDHLFTATRDTAENLYLAGYTDGDLQGANEGGSDAFVHKFNSDGDVLWTRQFGSSQDDDVRVSTTDVAGNLYVAGSTGGNIELSSFNNGARDIFFRKINGDGDILWTSQFGSTSSDFPVWVMSEPMGNIYILGVTYGVLVQGARDNGGTDVFLGKYNADGGVLWTKQFSIGGYDWPQAMTHDESGNVYIAGDTLVQLGRTDSFLRKYNADGDVLWTSNFGSPESNRTRSVIKDGDYLYLAGHTEGALQGANQGGEDAFLRKYTSDGTLLWTQQIGSPRDDGAYSVASDPAGNLYLTGYTGGTFEAANQGGSDVFLRKFVPSELR